jgi:peptide/nickel transport system permease protein
MRRGHIAFIKFRRNRLAVIGSVILGILVTFAFLADYIAPYSPFAATLADNLSPPSSQHIMGTDELGRDLLSRIIHGTRVSLQLGLISVTIALAFGITIGGPSGYYGGIVDQILMRLADVMLCFPTLVLAIMIVSVFGPGLMNAMIAVGISLTPLYARLVRSTFLYLRELDYVQSAKMIGAGDARIILRHMMPNSLAPLIVQTTLNVATAILSAASLGFLGLGAEPPTPEWGAMMSKGRIYLMTAPHITLFPGLAIMATVLSLNMIGDGLRDALDPRMT